MTKALHYLQAVNTTYAQLHKQYETVFWDFAMGKATLGSQKDAAQEKLATFCRDTQRKQQAQELQNSTSNRAIQNRLQVWIDFFDQYQMPDAAKEVKRAIDALESDIQHRHATRTEGYQDPNTHTFVKASTVKMRTLLRTHDDESVRKACFTALDKLALETIDSFVELVQLRNTFATLLGYQDFYDYKLRHEDKMSKGELFAIFDSITEKTSGHFENIRALAKTMPGLRKPWNFAYKMTGDFTKEEDPYFQFDQAVLRWGQSFSALGIDFKDGTLKLDLLDRKGKYNNGFCHWPDIVRYEGNTRIPASSNFTCNVVPGQIGSGIMGYLTLFHEGGHAAHLLNTTQKDVCLNHEYAPMTAAWAETHSMFIDTLFSSPEWKVRYAKNAAGEAYPFALFARKERTLNVLKPRGILGTIFVCQFERDVYELKKPTAGKIIALARENYRRFFDQDGDSLWALQIPHIYSWDSSCSYHGYCLAQVALAQWREYFYQKYGSIVDNPHVGKEMAQTWKWGSSKPFFQTVKEATNKKLSSAALVREINLSAEQVINRAQKRIALLETTRRNQKPVQLNAHITLVHGTKTIADNTVSFEQMAEKYGQWVQKQLSE
jgi:Zn-dependent oligopeptidase